MHRNLSFLSLLILAALFIWGETGCAPISKIEQQAITGSIPLSAESSLGQTFVARYDGLESIAIYFDPQDQPLGEMILTLLSDPQASTPLATSRLAAEDITTPGYYSFLFAPLPASTQAYYYAKFELTGQGIVNVGIAGGESYLNGALYQNDLAQDAQLAFQLGYQPSTAMLGLLQELGVWLWYLVIAAFLYILPGWGLFSCLWPYWSATHWGIKLSLASAASLVLYPLLLLWSDLVGLRLGAGYAWLPGLAGLLAIAWQNRQFFKRSSPAWAAQQSGAPDRQHLLPDLILIGLIGLVFIVRFWAVRGLEAPMWGDSYQHTVMTQLLVDHNGLFDSWRPYAELSSFTYHFGFHSLAAAFHWLSGLPAHLSVLWTGQLLNGLAVLSLLALALRGRRTPWAGVVAVLLAGLLTPMPMVYLNWGRYTQLAGQVILLGTIFLLWETIETPQNRRQMLALTSIILAGLALTHYRVMIFALCFLPAFFLLRPKTLPLRTVAVRCLKAGAGALFLFSPWAFRLFDSRLSANLVQRLGTLPSQVSQFVWQNNSLGDLSGFLPAPLWLLLALAAAWGLWRNQRTTAMLLAWWGAILLAANPQWLKLPGMGILTNFAVMIAIYIPAAILLGRVAGDVIEWLLTHPALIDRRAPRILLPGVSLFLAALVLTAGVLGGRQRLWDVNPPAHALVTRPDLRAAGWIQANLPQEARFLVNSFFAYGGSSVVGADAGWWLPLLAKRETNLPPLNYVSESGSRSDSIAWVNTLTAEIAAKGPDHPDTLAMLKERQIHYLYIGQRQGMVNNPTPLILPAQIVASPYYRLIYHHDRVWIFEIQSP